MWVRNLQHNFGSISLTIETFVKALRMSQFFHSSSRGEKQKVYAAHEMWSRTKLDLLPATFSLSNFCSSQIKMQAHQSLASFTANVSLPGKEFLLQRGFSWEHNEPPAATQNYTQQIRDTQMGFGKCTTGERLYRGIWQWETRTGGGWAGAPARNCNVLQRGRISSMRGSIMKEIMSKHNGVFTNVSAWTQWSVYEGWIMGQLID